MGIAMFRCRSCKSLFEEGPGTGEHIIDDFNRDTLDR